MKTFINTILFIFLIPYLGFGQAEATIWYFGKKAGIDFSKGKPVALTNSNLETEEGCVTICDKEGKLLFYTDGRSVWNTNHETMPNGTGLKGHPSSTQSGVVIPKSGSPNVYYLFTVTAVGNEEGFNYSMVNMNLNNGLGDVDPNAKNILLKTPVTEKLTAVKHRNNKDMWVIAHEWKSDAFLAYLVNDSGVSSQPVVSRIGTVHDGGTTNTQGYMKLNPDGTNLAIALEDSHIFELFDFDNVTGVISNPITLKLEAGSYTYGVEFSPNGSVLYGSAAGTGKIYQYNLQAGSNDAIAKSVTLVGESPNKEWIGALQLAGDGKIYYPIYGTPYLGAIQQPDVVGTSCNVQNNYISLEGRNAQLGLPTFSQSFFVEKIATAKVDFFDEKKVTVGQRFILNNILFDYAKFSLQPTSSKELDKLVKVLKTNNTLKIDLAGHTDNVGNKSTNIALSENRAKAVKEYLISKGVAENRISYAGKGSNKPLVGNETSEGRSKNRRVEFVLQK